MWNVSTEGRIHVSLFAKTHQSRSSSSSHTSEWESIRLPSGLLHAFPWLNAVQENRSSSVSFSGVFVRHRPNKLVSISCLLVIEVQCLQYHCWWTSILQDIKYHKNTLFDAPISVQCVVKFSLPWVNLNASILPKLPVPPRTWSKWMPPPTSDSAVWTLT